MILTIKEILDSFEGDIPELFTKTLGSLAPEDEIIRKQLPARLLRFDEDETAAVGVISSIRKDRDDEVLLSEGIDITNYSGIVLWNHNYYGGSIPHATNEWVAKDPTRGVPYRVVAKTQYLIEMSDLGNDVYRYRQAEHPLSFSVGFRSKESVRKDQTGYDEVYKDWVPRVKTMLKDLGLKSVPGEFDKPSKFITKWEMWEYSDVYVGSNVDAIQLAVKSGILTPDEAKLLVDFTAQDDPPPDLDADMIEALKARVEYLEQTMKRIMRPHDVDLSAMWNDADEQSLEKMWNETTG